MRRMLVAVGTELIEFDPSGGVATIFGRGIPRNPWRSLVGISATLSAFQCDYDANTFILSHNPARQ